MTQLLTNKQCLSHILQAIREAKKNIEVRMHIWRDDHVGNKLARALLAAADRGVKIHLRKDKIGAPFEHSEEFRQSMFHKEAGIYTHVRIIILDFAYPETSKEGKNSECDALAEKIKKHPNISYLEGEFWDHSKYWLIDDKTLFITSMNVEDKHFGKDVRGLVWRDNNVKITDKKVITQLKQKLSGKKVRGQENIFVNTDKAFEIKKKALDMLAKAKKIVRVHNAYWGDFDFAEALVACAQRGVEVEVVSPKRPNISADINTLILRQLFEDSDKKIKIYLCKEMLHAKTLLVDDQILMGSANFNRRGLGTVGEVDYYHKGKDAFHHSLISWMESTIHISAPVNRASQLKTNELRAILER